MCSRRTRHAGFTLVELVVSIVIVGVGVAGVMGAINYSSRASVDPMMQKQALSIAEALLEEVQLQPFTFCDPTDANAAVATTAQLDAAVTLPNIGCAVTVEAMGAEAGEIRTDLVTRFNNVNDYFVASPGLVLNGMSSLTGAAIQGLENYIATITLATQDLGGIAGTDANGRPQSILISVVVTGPANANVRLQGYRVRYAPTALP